MNFNRFFIRFCWKLEAAFFFVRGFFFAFSSVTFIRYGSSDEETWGFNFVIVAYHNARRSLENSLGSETMASSLVGLEKEAEPRVSAFCFFFFFCFFFELPVNFSSDRRFGARNNCWELNFQVWQVLRASEKQTFSWLPLAKFPTSDVSKLGEKPRKISRKSCDSNFPKVYSSELFFPRQFSLSSGVYFSSQYFDSTILWKNVFCVKNLAGKAKEFYFLREKIEKGIKFVENLKINWRKTLKKKSSTIIFPTFSTKTQKSQSPGSLKFRSTEKISKSISQKWKNAKKLSSELEPSK